MFALLVAVVVAVVIAAGWGAGYALYGRPAEGPFRGRGSKVRLAGTRLMTRQRTARTVLAVAAGIFTWLLTGWPVGAALVFALILTVPFFFGGAKVAAQRIDRLEAMEQWVRHLSDTMSVGGMPIQTIVKSADTAPAPIRPAVQRLANRLSTPRLDRTEALRMFADELDDSLGDIVVLALQRAVTARGGERVPHVLQALAEAVAAEVRARRTVEKSRSGPRKETQLIVIFLGVGVAALTMFTNFAKVYATSEGQVVLFVLSLIVLYALSMMRRLSTGGQPPRILPELSKTGTAADRGDPS